MKPPHLAVTPVSPVASRADRNQPAPTLTETAYEHVRMSILRGRFAVGNDRRRAGGCE